MKEQICSQDLNRFELSGKNYVGFDLQHLNFMQCSVCYCDVNKKEQVSNSEQFCGCYFR